MTRPLLEGPETVQFVHRPQLAPISGAAPTAIQRPHPRHLIESSQREFISSNLIGALITPIPGRGSRIGGHCSRIGRGRGVRSQQHITIGELPGRTRQGHLSIGERGFEVELHPTR